MNNKIKVNLSMKKVVKLLSFILLFTFTAKSQELVIDERYFFNNFVGITVGIGLTSYTGSVAFHADQVDCEPYRFDSKRGIETNSLFGLKAELKISRYFDFYASFFYEGRSADFAPQDYTEHVYVSDTKPFELASFRESLAANVSIFSITPMIKYKPFKFDLGFLVGPSFAFMISDELDAKESVTEPAELFFEDNGRRERTIYLGEIESKNSLLLDLKFGLGYGFMLTKQIKFSPEIFYILPLTKVSSEGDWKISSIHFLVSFSYGF
jgi:hypothetical protein